MYNFRYSLAYAPEARSDGSGCIDHDIWALYQEDGGDWTIVPGRHKTISIDAAELDAALNESTNQLKIAAYKEALKANVNNQPEPVVGWADAQLLALVEANAEASGVAGDADEFITVTLGLEYPVTFDM